MSRHGQPLDIRPTALALLALLGLALALPAAALAAEPVGRIIARSGGVSAIDEGGDRRRLDRRDPVYAGDTIRTGPRGRAQIRFVDSGMVDLEPRTRFGVDEYRQEQDGGNVVMNFLAGALRAVTGAIGDREEDEYRMNTPTATIGVRGTAYALRYCDADCADRTGGQAGLYGRVEDDFIVVDTPAGTTRFGEGEFFYVPEGGPPEGIVAPPDGILDGGDDQPGADASDLPDVGIRPGDEDGDDRFPADPGRNVTGPDYRITEDAQTVGPLMFAGAFAGGSTSGTALSDSAFLESGDVQMSGGAVTGADFPSSGFLSTSDMTLENSDATTVTNINQTTALFDVAWGRWSGDPVVDGESDGDGLGGFVFAYTDPANITPSSVLANKLNQFATYSDFDGPLAIQSNGDLWDVADLDLALDFQADSVTMNNFSIVSDGGTTANLAFNAPTGTIDDASSSLSINQYGDSDGVFVGQEFVGKFVGGNGEALIIRFDVQDTGSGDTITGIQILQERPPG